MSSFLAVPPASPTPREVARNPVGGHVPVAGGLAARGIPFARAMGAEAVQVFVANPRGWATPAGSPVQDERFRAACAELGLPVYVHAPYLINLGSHDATTAKRSVTSLRHSPPGPDGLGGAPIAAAGRSAPAASSCTPAPRPAAGRGAWRWRRSGGCCCRCWQS